MKVNLRDRVAGILAGLLLTAGLAGCGGEGNLTCDEPRRYQQAVQHDPLKSPEDLDGLDSVRAIPLPEANPAPERPAGSPCLDLPPRIGTSN